MVLRCKVFRAAEAGELELAINRFLVEELAELGPAQFEEITQSEGPGGVTVTVWYSLTEGADEILDDADAEFEGADEVDGKELA